MSTGAVVGANTVCWRPSPQRTDREHTRGIREAQALTQAVGAMGVGQLEDLTEILTHI